LLQNVITLLCLGSANRQKSRWKVRTLCRQKNDFWKRLGT